MRRNKLLTIALGLLIFLGFTSTILADVKYPEPTGFIVDDADVLSDKTEKDLTAKIEALQKEGKAEIAIVTIKSTKPLEIEQYSIKLAEKWKVGDKDVDNGVIFLLAVDDRKTRIEVGTGLEGILNDAKVGRMLDDHAVPHFKNNDWEKGIIETTNALTQVLASNEEAVAPNAHKAEEVNTSSALTICGLIFIIIVVMVFVAATPTKIDDWILFGILRAIGSGASGKSGSFGGGSFSGGGSSR